MSTVTVHPGATASGNENHPRHLVGNALRAVRVLVGAAFEVAVLGRVDERGAIVRRRLY
ncbi:hypothetical protein [Streptomyces hainanensis]|uniref:hypothetical protein n=1 Tax=Streptomyces hainanensis TaxID=402648 RepID=UPI0014050C99|nr:hypothetical protein [Streptomyces hainanensis]